jgi:hypothetical protein
MKAMSKFWTALVVGVAVMAVSTHSWAAPLTEVTYSTFTSWLGAQVAPDLTSAFDFEPTDSKYPGPDGQVTSVVFAGSGPVSGLYVYVYQITHFPSPTSSETKIEGMSFDLLGPWAVPGVLDPGTVAFQVNPNDGIPPDPDYPPPLGYTFGPSLFDATITPGPPGVPPSISFTIPSPFLKPHQVTWIFGFFSPVPPTTTVADVRNTGNTLTSPLVYTPSPEPSVGIMFGLGLLGIPIFGALRRKFRK